jgi:hypothetical protein
VVSVSVVITPSLTLQLNMSESKREDGYQITNDLLAKSIANDKKCTVDNVFIIDFSKTKGSNIGENFTSLLFAVNVKAKVKGQSETFNYMIKCLTSNELRAKQLKLVSRSNTKRYRSGYVFMV